MTGEVRLRLDKGHCIVSGRRSPNSLDREDFAPFGEEGVYDQKDSIGFINLFGLLIEVRASISGAGQKSE